MPETLSRYVCIAILVVGTACSGKFGYRLEVPVQGRLAVPEGVTGIRVELLDGDVTFQAGATGEILYSGSALKAADSAPQLAALESVEIEFTGQGRDAEGVLVLRGPQLPEGAKPEQNRIALSVVVRVPPAMPLDVRARAGNLAAIGMRAPVALSVERGILHLKNVRGDSTLRTGGGDLIIDGHRGGLDADTRSGKVFAWISELGAGGVRLVTGDGPIQARLPREASFRLDAEVEMGKAANEYGVPVVRKGDLGAEMEGSVGQGGPAVFLRTSQGRISLRRLSDPGESPVGLIAFGLLGILVLGFALFLVHRTAKKKIL